MLLYQAEVFTSTTPQVTLTQAWRQHIVDTYHLDAPGGGACSRLPPNPAQQQDMLKALANAAQASQMQVVKVKWRQ